MRYQCPSVLFHALFGRRQLFASLLNSTFTDQCYVSENSALWEFKFLLRTERQPLHVFMSRLCAGSFFTQTPKQQKCKWHISRQDKSLGNVKWCCKQPYLTTLGFRNIYCCVYRPCLVYPSASRALAMFRHVARLFVDDCFELRGIAQRGCLNYVEVLPCPLSVDWLRREDSSMSTPCSLSPWAPSTQGPYRWFHN